MTVGPLLLDEGWTLFRSLCGRRLPEQADETAARIVESCAGLPLALATAADWVASHPGWPLAALAERLADDGNRLDVLSPSADTGMRQAIVHTTGVLPTADAHLFRLLGLLPSTQVSTCTMVEISGRDTAAVRRTLARLAAVHLVTEQSPDNYVLDDLTWLFARELAESLSARERAELRQKVTMSYVNTTNSALVTVYFHDPVAAAATGPAEHFSPSPPRETSATGSTGTAKRETLLRAPVRGLKGPLERLAANYRLPQETELP